ncbi:hypothetical protein B0H16DRAFT_1733211 [Mycena metata]|uniref:CxC5 like cysteine cluster associated with KDZ domain-containing protein n=1 Tax=Mycena metata TaxID=1033252 RepID=A0AAD7MST9_9AGAR|nr:hypothetical protein B0H16DRAFT_1733211 [Mycena metata]
MDFQKICDTLKSHPEVADTFTHSDVVNPHTKLLFLRLSRGMFLRASFQVDDETAKLAWAIFREIAWAFDPGPEEQKANRAKHVKLFLLYGVEQRIDYPVTIFTLDLGALPAYSTSCYCRNCHTRYYLNYYVHAQATTRTYYLQDDIPEFIHSGEHFYASADLCELFANMMATAWTSGTNCARIYNTSISKHVLEPLMPTDWLRLQMDVDDVYNSFFLHALLLDHHERDAVLQLQHNAPSQAERLRPALEARNIRMAGPDKEERWVYLRSNITDGTTMGHYSCTALKKQCCITTCTAAAQVGFRTCALTNHRNAELYHYQRGKAMFQLKARLQRAKGSTPSSAFPSSEDNVPSTSRLPAGQQETLASGPDLLPALDGENVADGDDEETEYVLPLSPAVWCLSPEDRINKLKPMCRPLPVGTLDSAAPPVVQGCQAAHATAQASASNANANAGKNASQAQARRAGGAGRWCRLRVPRLVRPPLLCLALRSVFAPASVSCSYFVLCPTFLGFLWHTTSAITFPRSLLRCGRRLFVFVEACLFAHLSKEDEPSLPRFPRGFGEAVFVASVALCGLDLPRGAGVDSGARQCTCLADGLDVDGMAL